MEFVVVNVIDSRHDGAEIVEGVTSEGIGYLLNAYTNPQGISFVSSFPDNISYPDHTPTFQIFTELAALYPPPTPEVEDGA